MTSLLSPFTSEKRKRTHSNPISTPTSVAVSLPSPSPTQPTAEDVDISKSQSSNRELVSTFVTLEDNSYFSNLIVEDTGRLELISTSEYASDALLSPDKSTLFFVKDLKVYSREIETGEEEVVFDGSEYSKVWPSSVSSNSQVVTVHTISRNGDPYAGDETFFVYLDQNTVEQGISHNAAVAVSYKWSDSGSYVAAVQAGAGPGEIYVYKLGENGRYQRRGDFDTDHSQDRAYIFHLATDEFIQVIDYYDEPWSKFYRYDIASGEMTFYKRFDGLVSFEGIPSPGRQIYKSSEEGSSNSEFLKFNHLKLSVENIETCENPVTSSQQYYEKHDLIYGRKKIEGKSARVLFFCRDSTEYIYLDSDTDVVITPELDILVEASIEGHKLSFTSYKISHSGIERIPGSTIVQGP